MGEILCKYIVTHSPIGLKFPLRKLTLNIFKVIFGTPNGNEFSIIGMVECLEPFLPNIFAGPPKCFFEPQIKKIDK